MFISTIVWDRAYKKNRGISKEGSGAAMAYHCPNCGKEDAQLQPKICHRCGKLICTACSITAWKNPTGAIINEILCEPCKKAREAGN